MSGLSELKSGVIVLAFVALLGASAAIALTSFQATQIGTVAGCNSTTQSACGFAYNITGSGLSGVNNSTSYLGTIGTLMGVGALVAVVVGAFFYMGRR